MSLITLTRKLDRFGLKKLDLIGSTSEERPIYYLRFSISVIRNKMDFNHRSLGTVEKVLAETAASFLAFFLAFP